MTVSDSLGYLAMATGIFAALAISADLGRRITGSAFLVFTISSLSWIAVGYLEDEPPLLIQNVVLTGVNVFGVYRWLIRQPSRNSHSRKLDQTTVEARRSAHNV
ncbi:hypothetical protein [Maricaulis sp. CAU 1757]